MRVAGEDRVDPGHLGEIGRGVLVHATRRRGRQAGVHQRHDEIRPGRAHLGDVTARRLDDVDGEHPALEIGAVPLHDLGRHEADHADL